MLREEARRPLPEPRLGPGTWRGRPSESRGVSWGPVLPPLPHSAQPVGREGLRRPGGHESGPTLRPRHPRASWGP